MLDRAYDILDGRPWPTGIGDRVRANKFTERWDGQEDALRAQRETVERPTGTDLDERDVLYGQSAAFVHAVRPAAEVVREIVADAESLPRPGADRMTDDGMNESAVGVVHELRRYPVKSMLGETLRACRVHRSRSRRRSGRRAARRPRPGRVVSVKYPKRWGRMFELRAVTDDAGVQVCFPDGTRYAIDDDALAARLSDFFGRAVTVADRRPRRRDVRRAVAARPEGRRRSVPRPAVQTVDGEELIEGGQFMSAQGTFFNYGAVHLVTTGTTRRLTELAPATRFDAQRFRPNVVVDTPETGFVETDWVGRTLTIGDVQLA